MVQIVSFLVNQGSKVLRWFAPDFWEHLQRLSGFFSYIWSEVQKNVAPVYNTLFSAVSDVFNRAQGFIYQVANTVRGYASDLHGIAIGEVNLLGYRFAANLQRGMDVLTAAITAIRDTFIAILNSFIARTQVLINDLTAQFAGFVGSIIPKVVALINTALLPVTQFINRNVGAINAQISKTNATIKAISIVIDMFTGQVREKLTAFVTNPLGFILALILPVLVDVILQMLAEGFGAVQDTIPTRKDYATNAARDTLGFQSSRTAAIADELSRQSSFERTLDDVGVQSGSDFNRFEQEFARQLVEIGGDRNRDDYRPPPPTGTAQSRPF